MILFNAGNIPQLNNEQKILLDNPLSLIEISEALKEMAMTNHQVWMGLLQIYIKFLDGY